MILGIKARELLDSRGNPTIEAEVKTKKGVFKAMVPSGASKGAYEAVELRDNDLTRLNGKGVLKAVNNVNSIISKEIKGMDETDQRAIDNIMIKLDGTANKSNLGANAILSVSMAVSRAGASANNQELYEYIKELSKTKKNRLPTPSLNIINGGAHAGNELGFQEFMIYPKKAKSFKQAMIQSCEVYHELKSMLIKNYGLSAINVGDEGGFAPQISTANQALDLINSSIISKKLQGLMDINLDCAANEMLFNGKYNLNFKSKKALMMSADELLDYYEELAGKYPIYSIEDPFSEDDWKSFSEITKRMGKKVQIVGDDLLVTNAERIKKAINLKSCNCLLLKINQIGTITESIKSAKIARAGGLKIMVSHRSGETEDDYIADFAAGISSEQIKSGAPSRSERTSKYNRLIRIEELSGYEL
ncbi:MAG: phosphopyruvate hydratase [Candidatus Nanoarchaeia archaeon]|nr:phosphopyruvate hydratase [Candidatus Nanoarchaeia archaeon]MDD5499448.1 phosphopyruvate hydratase [Candidatus Nanoarchaeia archaeon]